MRTILTIVIFLSAISIWGQDKKETKTYFDQIKEIVSSEKAANNLLHRLDTLKVKFIPSRSDVIDYFNREIEYGYRQRRVYVHLNFAGFQIDLLCYNDSVYLSSITSTIYQSITYNNYNPEVINNFLKKRNKFYNSSATPMQLVRELSTDEEYAFYCGDGNPKTSKGIYIEQLVEEENTDKLTDMLRSFNCETQAYGVAGFSMLSKQDYEVPLDLQRIIDHIKKRNSELVVCSGCLSGLISKIYSVN